MSEDAPITAFRDEYAFLSNFSPHPVTLDGETYLTAEHAFQTLKSEDPVERRLVREASAPYAAKRLGKKVTLREGWNDQRFAVMERVMRAKFSDPALSAALLATGDRELIEGNNWRDTTWGCVRAKDGTWKGRNALGKILMMLRMELASSAHDSQK